MKPAVCIVCGKSGSKTEGDWVEFSDYSTSPMDELGHPDGFEWFCSDHLSAAKKLSNKPLEEAIILLNNKFNEFEVPYVPQRKQKYKNKKESRLYRIIKGVKNAMK